MSLQSKRQFICLFFTVWYDKDNVSLGTFQAGFLATHFKIFWFLTLHFFRHDTNPLYAWHPPALLCVVPVGLGVKGNRHKQEVHPVYYIVSYQELCL